MIYGYHFHVHLSAIQPKDIQIALPLFMLSNRIFLLSNMSIAVSAVEVGQDPLHDGAGQGGLGAIPIL